MGGSLRGVFLVTDFRSDFS